MINDCICNYINSEKPQGLAHTSKRGVCLLVPEESLLLWYKILCEPVNIDHIFIPFSLLRKLSDVQMVDTNPFWILTETIKDKNFFQPEVTS